MLSQWVGIPTEGFSRQKPIMKGVGVGVPQAENNSAMAIIQYLMVISNYIIMYNKSDIFQDLNQIYFRISTASMLHT